jgi:hypothetical protein
VKRCRRNRDRQQRLASERTRHNLASREKARRNRYRKQREIDGRTHPQSPWPRILAPKRFGLAGAQSRADVIKFLNKLRRITLVKKRGVVIDFKRTERMYACGTLLFVAELERIRRTRGGDNSCFRCTYPKDRIVEQVLQQVGILDLLRAKSRLSEHAFAENVRHWKYATGLEVEGAKFEGFHKAFEGKVANALLTDFYAGITEAMTNSVHHAYEGDRGDGIGLATDLRRWWMFSQERNNILSVAFCDTGIGIPRSIVTSGQWSESVIGSILKRLGFGGDSEGELIRSAIELHKSRTGQEHRGRGLGEIVDVVRRSAKGNFTIHSNRGLYRYNAETSAELITDYTESIMGTLILWNVPLSTGESK